LLICSHPSRNWVFNVFVNFPKRVSGGSHNASFRSTFEYLMDESKHPEREIIAGTIGATTPRDAAHACGFFRSMRPDIAKPCVHFAIGYAPEDGDRMRGKPELRREIAANLVSELLAREWEARTTEAVEAGREPPKRPDPTSYAWMMVTHHEKGHVHDHVVLCRIGGDGTLWIGKNEARAARVIARDLEKTYGLREIDREGSPLRERQRNPRHTHPKHDREQASQRRTGKPALRAQVAAHIRGWLADHEGQGHGLSIMQAALREHGICIEEKRDAYGRVRGHVIESGGEQWTGAQLGLRGRDTIAAAIARCEERAQRQHGHDVER
jgi:Relaxase/Mobilisation nuclease domain